MSDDFTKWFGVKGGMSADPFGIQLWNYSWFGNKVDAFCDIC